MVSLVVVEAESCGTSLYSLQSLDVTLVIWIPDTAGVFQDRFDQGFISCYFDLLWTKPYISVEESKDFACLGSSIFDVLFPTYVVIKFYSKGRMRFNFL